MGSWLHAVEVSMSEVATSDADNVCMKPRAGVNRSLTCSITSGVWSGIWSGRGLAAFRVGVARMRTIRDAEHGFQRQGRYQSSTRHRYESETAKAYTYNSNIPPKQPTGKSTIPDARTTFHRA